MYKKYKKKLEFMRDKLNKRLSSKNTNLYNYNITTLITEIDNALNKINQEKEIDNIENKFHTIEREFKAVDNLDSTKIIDKDINMDTKQYIETIKVVKQKKNHPNVIERQGFRKIEIYGLKIKPAQTQKEIKEQLRKEEPEKNLRIIKSNTVVRKEDCDKAYMEIKQKKDEMIENFKEEVINYLPVSEGLSIKNKNNKWYNIISNSLFDITDRLSIREKFTKYYILLIISFFLILNTFIFNNDILLLKMYIISYIHLLLGSIISIYFIRIYLPKTVEYKINFNIYSMFNKKVQNKLNNINEYVKNIDINDYIINKKLNISM